MKIFQKFFPLEEKKKNQEYFLFLKQDVKNLQMFSKAKNVNFNKVRKFKKLSIWSFMYVV